MMASYVLHFLCLILFICGLNKECASSQGYVASSGRILVDNEGSGPGVI
jgi:hypothetical protein